MSFLNNPVVRDTLKNLDRRRGGSTTDFIKALGFGVAGSFLQNLTSRLPQMKQNQANQLAYNKDMAVKEIETTISSLEPERKYWQNYTQDGKAFLDQERLKAWKETLPYAKLKARNMTDAATLLEDEYLAWEKNFTNEQINRLNQYEKDEFITTKNPFTLIKPVLQKYADENVKLNSNPKYRNAIGYFSSLIKEKHGPIVEAEVKAQSTLDLPETQEKLNGIEQVTDIMLNPDNVRAIQSNYTPEGDYIISSIRDFNKAFEETNKADKLLKDRRLFADNFRMELPTEAGGTKDVKIMSSSVQKDAKIRRWSSDKQKYVVDESISGDSESISTALSILHGEAAGYFYDDYDRLGVVGGDSARMIGHIRGFKRANMIRWDGDSVVIDLPRRDYIDTKLREANLVNPTATDVVNAVFSDNVKSSNAPTMDELYGKYRQDVLRSYNKALDAAYKSKEFKIELDGETLTYEDILSLRQQFVNMKDTESKLIKDRIMFLSNPSEKYKNMNVKIGDELISLQNISPTTIETLVKGWEEEFNDGVVDKDLRASIPEPPSTEPLEGDEPIDDQIKELTSEEKKEEEKEGLTMEDLFGTTGSPLLRALVSPADVDTPRRRSLLDR